MPEKRHIYRPNGFEYGVPHGTTYCGVDNWTWTPAYRYVFDGERDEAKQHYYCDICVMLSFVETAL